MLKNLEISVSCACPLTCCGSQRLCWRTSRAAALPGSPSPLCSPNPASSKLAGIHGCPCLCPSAMTAPSRFPTPAMCSSTPPAMCTGCRPPSSALPAPSLSPTFPSTGRTALSSSGTATSPATPHPCQGLREVHEALSGRDPRSVLIRAPPHP